MITWIKHFVENHPDFAPLAIAGSLFIAGFNIPISADIVILIAATLAATLLKGAFFKLYLAVYIGSILAAYAGYLLGRVVGLKLLQKSFFKKLVPPARVEKIQLYYQKYAWPTLLIGRFIPFGFRNALFLTAGLSKLSFKSFALKDAVATLLWSSTLFSSFYWLVLHAENALETLKKGNLILFLCIGVTLISVLWYKKIKQRRLAG